MSTLRRPIDWDEVKRKAREGVPGTVLADRFHVSKQWFYHRKSTHRDPEIRALFTRNPLRKEPHGTPATPD